jgi:hypothetical protein
MKRSTQKLIALACAMWLRASTLQAQTHEAAERFSQAIRLVNEGDLSGALAEFRRIQSIAPSALVAYNLGLLYAALQRPVQSVQALEQALTLANALKPEHLTRLNSVLLEQRARIGLIALRVNVQEGAVQVDNVEVATLPLTAALEVASGNHVIGVVSEGHAPARKEIAVAGQQREEVTLHLVPIDARLAHIVLHSTLPAAAVFVDGERVGETPLEASVTVLPGERVIEVRRSGYVTQRRALTLHQGATAELTLNPTIDHDGLRKEAGVLSVEACETQATVAIDGSVPALLQGPIALPVGPHRLRLERGGFAPAERDVTLTLGETTRLKVQFQPSAETRVAYVEHARRRRNWSWATIGVGVALAASGTAAALTLQHGLPHARHERTLARLEWKPDGVCDFFGTEVDPQETARCQSRLNHASNRVSHAELGRTSAWLVAGVGGAALVAGVILLLTGPALHKYDQSPELAAGPSWRWTPQVTQREASLGVVGWF